MIFCHKKIEIEGTKGIGVTYCMRPVNHEGKCNINMSAEDIQKVDDNLTTAVNAEFSKMLKLEKQ